jgi:chromosome segregation ATPase
MDRRHSMRKTIWIAIASAALFAGACKKKDETAKEMDRSATTASKAQENVNDQVKDVQGAQKDLNKDMSKDQADVNKQQGELNSAKADLASARDHYRDAAKQRLAKLDDDIRQLEARSDAAAKATVAKLRTERDELSTKINAIGDQAQANWDTFKKDVDDRFDRAEKDARDALDKTTK